jgi:hypothetical protein
MSTGGRDWRYPYHRDCSRFKLYSQHCGLVERCTNEEAHSSPSRAKDNASCASCPYGAGEIKLDNEQDLTERTAVFGICTTG